MQTTNTTGGKYKQGMRIEITGAEIAADNGTFEIGAPFPAQPNGDDYLQYRRVGAGGKVSVSKSTNNLRGHRASWLDRHAKIIA